MADHHYFTSSKGCTYSFTGQSSDKGKAWMSDNNDEISLTDVVVAQPSIVDENELIQQLINI